MILIFNATDLIGRIFGKHCGKDSSPESSLLLFPAKVTNKFGITANCRIK